MFYVKALERKIHQQNNKLIFSELEKHVRV